MTRKHFLKIAGSPEQLNIFEFCKKHYQKPFGESNYKVSVHEVEKWLFKKNIFSFQLGQGSFQGLGHFRKKWSFFLS